MVKAGLVGVVQGLLKGSHMRMQVLDRLGRLVFGMLGGLMSFGLVVMMLLVTAEQFLELLAGLPSSSAALKMAAAPQRWSSLVVLWNESI